MSLIVVQRGHVPRTSGKTGAPGEQAFAIATAERVDARCRALGHSVRIIDADPPSVSAYRGDVFVALHYDSSANPGVRGASVGYRTAEGAELARAWKRHYVNNGWSGGFRADNYTANLAGYYGVKRAVEQGNRRAIITEAGFHSNAADAALLAAPAGPDRVAIAVAAAVVDLLGTTPGCPPAAPPAGLPAYPGTVRMGDRGPAVAVWQQQLLRRGYFPGALGLPTPAPDGIFGPAMNHTVIDWQTKHGLEADGVAGPATWHSLLFA